MMTGRARFAAAAAIALSLTAPSIAGAEPQTIMAGTVVDFHGKYGLVVRDPRGALAEVALHQGTIIKPVGLRLERGMKVIIIGQAANEAFAAGEILAPLEQRPPARAAALARSYGNDAADQRSLPNRDYPNTRWQESPDFNIPIVREPTSPH